MEIPGDNPLRGNPQMRMARDVRPEDRHYGIIDPETGRYVKINPLSECKNCGGLYAAICPCMNNPNRRQR